MKRKLAILLAVVLMVFGLAYYFQPDRSIDAATFQPRFSETLQKTGLETVEIGSTSGIHAPLPWNLRLRPHRAKGKPHPLSIGFADSTEHYKLAAKGSPPVDCTIQYLDGRAAFIIIHAIPTQSPAAQTLRSALATEFPSFPITLTSDKD